MELKKGYKQTEVGIIPDDWELRKFDEVTNAITCGIAATPTYVSEAVGMPFLSASHVQDSRVIFEDYKFITKELYHQITKHNKPERGDILYTRVGAGIGQAGVIDFDFDFAIYVSLTLIKVKPNIDNNFIKFLLNSNYYQFLAKNGQFAGGGVQNLNVNVVKEFPIVLPPTKAEQTAIATALSDMDDLINSLSTLIEKKKAIKHGAMQQLLKPKEGWVVKKLGDCAVIKARIGWQGLTTSEYRKNGDYYLITGTEFRKGIVDWDSCHHVDEIRYLQDKYIQVREKDVLVTKDGTIGKIAIIKSIVKPATLNSGVFVIRPIENAFDPEFFYYLLLSKYFTDFLSQLTAGSTINHLYQKDFVTFSFFVPSKTNEQKEIARILSDMDTGIQTLEQNLSKYQMLKQGMMQELLTGKTRLV